jgi:hypothetical protein
VLGQNVLSIIRQDKNEKVFEKIVNQYPDHVENTSYLATFFNKYFKLDKWVILEIIKKNKGRYSIDELEKIIELDSKTKKK